MTINNIFRVSLSRFSSTSSSTSLRSLLSTRWILFSSPLRTSHQRTSFVYHIVHKKAPAYQLHHLWPPLFRFRVHSADFDEKGSQCNLQIRLILLIVAFGQGFGRCYWGIWLWGDFQVHPHFVDLFTLFIKCSSQLHFIIVANWRFP